MEEREKDIEMGNTVSNKQVDNSNNTNNKASYLCCPSDYETDKDDSSTTTFRDTKDNNFPVDEDDLGDNEDELQQIKFSFENRITTYKIDDNDYEKKTKNKKETEENDDCFNVNKEFFKIIERAGSTNIDDENNDDSEGFKKYKKDSFDNDISTMRKSEDGQEAGMHNDNDVAILHNMRVLGSK